MRIFFTLLLCISTVFTSNAIEIKVSADSTTSAKYKLWLSGRIDAYAYFDSQKTLSLFNGVQYIMPARPDIDPSTGQDLIYSGQTRFNVASSRMGVGGSIQLDKDNSVMGYVELDFLDPNGGSILGFRLRHAFARLTMGSSQFLFGQTSHLSLYEEIAAPTVTFGSGYPYSVLSRPIQFRFTQLFADGLVKMDIAASMFWCDQYQWQADAMVPDLSLRVAIGNPATNTFAVIAGYKSLLPKLDGVDPNARVNAFYGGFMGRATFQGLGSVRGGLLYGGDLSTLGMLGGFAQNVAGTGYETVNTLSMWLDLSSPNYDGFEFGIFGGYQSNLGTSQAVNTSELQSTGLTLGVQNYMTLAPRAWYHYKMLSFGVEYAYGLSHWMDDWNSRYQPPTSLPASINHRVSLLCRFTF